MAGPSDTLGSPWPPHAICLCLELVGELITDEEDQEEEESGDNDC
jgi:hypothetical protein